MKLKKKSSHHFCLILFGCFFVAPTISEEIACAASAVRRSPQSEKIDLDALSKVYGADTGSKGSVVQNRTFKKEGKLSFEILGGVTGHDPFLSGKYAGGLLGYNFNEYFGVNLFYWQVWDVDSSAMKTLRDQAQTIGADFFGVNVNRISSNLGLELNWYILYGKLSLLGLSILHFDLFLTGGVGRLGTQNGTIYSPWVGVGQQVYVSQKLAIRLNYRFLYYSENLIEQNEPSKIGKYLVSQQTMNHALDLGLIFYLF